MYTTSKSFMDHFGLKSVKDLPKLKDLHILDNEIGTPSDLVDEMDIPVDLPPGFESGNSTFDSGSLDNSSNDNSSNDEWNIDPYAQ